MHVYIPWGQTSLKREQNQDPGLEKKKKKESFSAGQAHL